MCLERHLFINLFQKHSLGNQQMLEEVPGETMKKAEAQPFLLDLRKLRDPDFHLFSLATLGLFAQRISESKEHSLETQVFTLG